MLATLYQRSFIFKDSNIDLPLVTLIVAQQFKCVYLLDVYVNSDLYMYYNTKCNNGYILK